MDKTLIVSSASGGKNEETARILGQLQIKNNPRRRRPWHGNSDIVCGTGFSARSLGTLGWQLPESNTRCPETKPLYRFSNSAPTPGPELGR